jgi:hypothetical protein
LQMFSYASRAYACSRLPAVLGCSQELVPDDPLVATGLPESYLRLDVFPSDASSSPAGRSQQKGKLVKYLIAAAILAYEFCRVCLRVITLRKTSADSHSQESSSTYAGKSNPKAPKPKR